MVLYVFFKIRVRVLCFFIRGKKIRIKIGSRNRKFREMDVSSNQIEEEDQFHEIFHYFRAQY